jgi:hypothetical protein
MVGLGVEGWGNVVFPEVEVGPLLQRILVTQRRLVDERPLGAVRAV